MSLLSGGIFPFPRLLGMLIVFTFALFEKWCEEVASTKGKRKKYQGHVNTTQKNCLQWVLLRRGREKSKNQALGKKEKANPAPPQNPKE